MKLMFKVYSRIASYGILIKVLIYRKGDLAHRDKRGYVQF